MKQALLRFWNALILRGGQVTALGALTQLHKEASSDIDDNSTALVGLLEGSVSSHSLGKLLNHDVTKRRLLSGSSGSDWVKLRLVLKTEQLGRRLKAESFDRCLLGYAVPGRAVHAFDFGDESIGGSFD